MNKCIITLINLFLLFPLAIVYAQEEQGPFSKETDSLYREDQFYVGITYNLISDKPIGVSLRGLSGGVHFGYLRDMPINKKRNVAIAVGAGLSFDTYGQNLFIGERENEETIFTVLDDGIDFDRNRLTTYTIEAPVEFRWRSSTAETYKFWRVYAGFRVGYIYYYKTTFRQPDNDVFQTDIPEFDALRTSATLSFGYNTVNFYVSYSINPFFKNATTTDGQDVTIRTIKLGLLFYIL